MKRRVFAAIDISEQARQAATEYVEQLRSELHDTPVRWERPEKLHITVKFAGSLDEEQLTIFTEMVKAAANTVAPFQMKIAGCGAFVKGRGPSVLWLGVEQLPKEDPLGKIARMLVNEEKRPFHPHVTIARIKHPAKAKDVIEKHRSSRFTSEEFEVGAIVIYESRLHTSGSVYSVLESFRLRTD
jgi:RNA 2',3'-cyclic 3'-phosphodiesterase